MRLNATPTHPSQQALQALQALHLSNLLIYIDKQVRSHQGGAFKHLLFSARHNDAGEIRRVNSGRLFPTTQLSLSHLLSFFARFTAGIFLICSITISARGLSGSSPQYVCRSLT